MSALPSLRDSSTGLDPFGSIITFVILRKVSSCTCTCYWTFPFRPPLPLPSTTPLLHTHKALCFPPCFSFISSHRSAFGRIFHHPVVLSLSAENHLVQAKEMSQRVPNWKLHESSDRARLTFHGEPDSHPDLQEEAMLDYEMAELTWENGHLAMHSLGLPRAASVASLGKSSATLHGKYAWDKPQAGGTLESIVNQAAGLPLPKASYNDLLPWFDHQRAAASANIAMDALVPCSNPSLSVDEQSTRVPGSRQLVSSAGVGSCSARKEEETGSGVPKKRSRATAAPAPASRSQDGASSMNQTVSRSESRQVTGETGDQDPTSPENTSFGEPLSSYSKQTANEHDASSRSRPQRGGRCEDDKKKANTGRSSASLKRSRAAAIHNQSERKRRDRINQRMKTLQKLVPNSSKTDKASMLDEVIEYLKQLQAQVQMMSKIGSLPHMMLPMAMQQMQMAMMAQMGMGMSMGMGVMDMNTMARPGQTTGLPPALHPSTAAAFLPLTTAWDGSSDRLAPPAAAAMADPMSTFLACQTQPMTLDAYNRMAALYQHLYQQTGPPCSKT